MQAAESPNSSESELEADIKLADRVVSLPPEQPEDLWENEGFPSIDSKKKKRVIQGKAPPPPLSPADPSSADTSDDMYTDEEEDIQQKIGREALIEDRG